MKPRASFGRSRDRRAQDVFCEHVLERFASIGAVRSKAMFGGFGLYLDQLFFALIAGERLYFKVDDRNRARFVDAGCEPFHPFGDERHSMSYFEVPERVLANDDRLKAWTIGALEAARAAKKPRATKARRSSASKTKRRR